jgi:hypothetical protein
MSPFGKVRDTPVWFTAHGPPSVSLTWTGVVRAWRNLENKNCRLCIIRNRLMSVCVGGGVDSNSPPPPLAWSVKINAKTTVNCSQDSSMGESFRVRFSFWVPLTCKGRDGTPIARAPGVPVPVIGWYETPGKVSFVGVPVTLAG